VPPPEGELADVVTALVAGTDAVGLARLELALRALAGRLGRSGTEARVFAVRRTPDALEVVLDGPAAPAHPWRAGGEEGRTWVLPASVPFRDLTDDARAVAPPCPALVGLGHDESGAEVFVDLEAVGVLDLGGSEVARHVTATLAVTPLADELMVVTVGEVLPELSGRHEVRAMPDLPSAVVEVEAMTAPIAAATGGDRSTFRLRSVAGHEPWEPVVVILTDPPSPDDPSWEALRALVSGHRGVAVVGAVLPADPEATVVAGDDGTLAVAGWTVRPHGLDEADANRLATTIRVEDVSADVLDEMLDDADNLTGITDEQEPWALMVRVLGPVDVVTPDGASAEFDRLKALELVVWLAQHRHTATRTGARAALWEADVSNASFSNVVSDARRTLGRLAAPPAGEEWLARTYAERLPLHAAVVLDADVVRRRLNRAYRLADDEAIDELRGALTLVRGAPYSGQSYLWPDAEALPATLTLLATTVAVELGRRLLDRGDDHLRDIEGVLEATAVGLEVLPGHEELVALRLRAHAARGDRVALRHEYACYEQSLLADPWAGDPSPALASLRRDLLTSVVAS
jgi:two-component SAPR family response regulator